MKKIAILTFSLFAFCKMNSQITISSADMPNAGDSILLSVTNSIGTLDQTLTGASYNWDFSTLTFNTQREDKFDSPLSFPTVFAILFNIINTSYGRENRAITSVSLTGLTITDAYDFLKESSSALKQVGGGLTINGAPIPFYYSPNDFIYRFPLNYLNNDSSDYAYNLTIPTIGYYGETGHRVNIADGWGSLVTPYTTYPNVLRVKSVISSQDTLNYTSLGFGITIPRPTRIEYKWLANGKQIPVLEIDVNIVGGTEIITNVQYQDSVHSSTSVNELTQPTNFDVAIYPNPTNDNFMLEYNLKSNSPIVIELNDANGKNIQTIYNELGYCGKNIKLVKTSDLNLSSGNYFVKVYSNEFTETKKIMIQK